MPCRGPRSGTRRLQPRPSASAAPLPSAMDLCCSCVGGSLAACVSASGVGRRAAALPTVERCAGRVAGTAVPSSSTADRRPGASRELDHLLTFRASAGVRVVDHLARKMTRGALASALRDTSYYFWREMRQRAGFLHCFPA